MHHFSSVSSTLMIAVNSDSNLLCLVPAAMGFICTKKKKFFVKADFDSVASTVWCLKALACWSTVSPGFNLLMDFRQRHPRQMTFR